MPKLYSAIKASFNIDLCNHLEYHLCRAFRNSTDNEIKWLWCDGIMIPDFESVITEGLFNQSKVLITKAFIGTDGQGGYEMTIKFGPNVLDKLINGSALVDCLPGEETMNWVAIDIPNKIIKIELE